MDHAERVKQYYNRNTARFLRWGDHNQTKSIHQPVWRQPSFTKEQALHYPHELINSQIQKLRGQKHQFLHVADFGSGVGASIKYLAELNPNDYFYAITISKTQNEIASKWLQDFEHVQCLEANFLEYDFAQKLDCIFQIESFNHVAARERLIFQVTSKLINGGYWIILDDFLTEDGLTSKWIDQYEKGWLLGKIDSLVAFTDRAKSSGLEVVQDQDLTPYLRLGRTRDKLIKALNPLISQLAKVNHYARSWYGGLGRQESLKRGLIQYRFVVLRQKDQETERPRD